MSSFLIQMLLEAEREHYEERPAVELPLYDFPDAYEYEERRRRESEERDSADEERRVIIIDMA